MTLRIFLGLIGASMFLAAAAGQTMASDFQHTCRTADGLFELNDDELYAAGVSGQPIAYQSVRKTVLAERRGYCVAAGQTFQFESRSYVHRIRFNNGAGFIEVDALCEFAADGLPAAYTCEREVITFQTGGAGGQSGDQSNGGATGAPTKWNHNGSLMLLEASGAERRFVYDVPRQGMIAAGARPGDVVFAGRREGATYSGTAYIYSPSCGQVGYPVAGNVSSDERSVVLEGQAPRLGSDCTVKSYRRDRLQFDLLGR